MSYPRHRMRRLREQGPLREMIRETVLRREDLIMPLFVEEGLDGRREIGAMPGQFRLSIDELVGECRRLEGLGIRGVLLFGIPGEKDPVGSGAYAEAGIVQRAVAAVREAVPGLLVVTDICLCESTSHGHCGVVEGDRVVLETLTAMKRAGVGILLTYHAADAARWLGETR